MKHLLPLLLIFLLLGCDSSDDRKSAPAEPPQRESSAEEAQPPQPPLRETFEEKPQLSLFPRAGAFRPADSEKKALAYWETYIDHLRRTSGLIREGGADSGRAWALRSIKGIDSVAYFSPLAVTPGTSYRVSFAFRGDLPEGGEAGVGVLEFDRFLWIGDQFPESLVKKHLSGSHDGVRLTEGAPAWETHSFTFTTSPKTRMVHLILFRDGTAARRPVLFDDIEITATAG